jgi:crotonobetainyl-CoA:carnitine CoA-transferase CaiB-like acyl-CoA transferase
MSQGGDKYRDGPLAGVRVLELGSTVAAPFCGRLLADFGAQVVKIEEAAGDPVRSMGKRLDGRSLYAASIFRNKQLISIDLRRAEGQALVRTLARNSDVLIENFRPGTLERWNLGYERLAADNPALVMVRISGFGQTGPYAQRPGYGVIAEAIGGLRHLTGDPDRPPSRVATSLTDYLCGLHGAFGALMALQVARETGRGQVVDASLLESAFAVTEPHIPAYDKLGTVAMRAGSRLPDNVPNALFECADGEFIHIATVGEPTFRRLVAAMGAPSLAEDPRFRSAADRARNQAAVEAAITAWTRAQPLSQVEATLQRHDVPATRIYTMADIFRDPHFAARHAIVAAPDAALGSIKMANVFPCLSATPGRVRRAGGGTVGGDTRSVLRELAALTDTDIDALQDSGVVVCGDRGT